MCAFCRFVASVAVHALLPTFLAAAPPVVVGAFNHLDRPGPRALGRHDAFASGNGAGLVGVCWRASGTFVQARVYDVAGLPRTPVIDVSESSEGPIAILVAADGSFLVAWVADCTLGVSCSLFGRWFRADGGARTTAFVMSSSVITGVLLHGDAYRVALAAQGSVLAAWQMSGQVGATRLVARRYDTTGQAMAAEHEVAADEGRFTGLALAVLGDRALLLYGKPRPGSPGVSDASARRLDLDGNPTGSEFAIAPPDPFDSITVPRGAILFPDGRLNAVVQTCDHVSVGPSCQRGSSYWVDASNQVSTVYPLEPPTVFAQVRGPVADPFGNPGALVVDGTRQRAGVTVSNPLAAPVASTVVSLPPPWDIPWEPSLVPVGPARFAVVWYDGDWTYLQTLTVGSEATSAPVFHTLVPCRLLDSRESGVPLLAGIDVAVPAAGRCAIPPEAKALALNVTSVGPTDAGNVHLYAADRLAPSTSVLNYSAGQTRAGFSVAPVGANGHIGVRASQARGTTDLILDVTGYFQ